MIDHIHVWARNVTNYLRKLNMSVVWLCYELAGSYETCVTFILIPQSSAFMSLRHLRPGSADSPRLRGRQFYDRPGTLPGDVKKPSCSVPRRR